MLTRAGHTEAGCDLARLAGFEPAAVIVEILNEDGTMARRPQLEAFAREHGLKIGTIADLIRYRLQHEESVERVAEHAVDTEFGPFRLVAYEDHVSRNVHLALVKGDLTRPEPPLVRVHVQDTLGDVVGVRSPELGWPLRSAMEQIAQAGHGVVVLLHYAESPARAAGGRPLTRPASRRRTPGAARWPGSAQLRHRRADPAGPRRAPDARPQRAEADARPIRLRARGSRVRGRAGTAPRWLIAGPCACSKDNSSPAMCAS